MQLPDLRIVVIVLVFEILRTVRMVVAISRHPFVKLRPPAIQVGRRAALVLVRVGPRVEVEIIVQLAVRAAERDRAEFAAEGTVVDIFGGRQK